MVELVINELKKYFYPHATFRVSEITLNEKSVKALCVTEPRNEIGPAFLVDNICEIFQYFGSAEAAARSCFLNFLSDVASRTHPDISLALWENAKEFITLRIAGIFEPTSEGELVKMEWNSFTVVFQVEVPDYTLHVTESLLSIWGVDRETVLNRALDNTPNIYTPVLVSDQDHEDELSLEQGHKIPGLVHFFYDRDANDERSDDGFRCIMYDWFRKFIANEIGSFYVLPVSRSDAMLLSEIGLGMNCIERIFSTFFALSHEIPYEYRLPATILRYDAESCELKQVC